MRSIASADYALNPIFSISIPAESRLLVKRLSEQMNRKNGDFIRYRVSASIKTQLLEMILRHTETAVAMKARFAALAETLKNIRKDTPQNYIQDLQMLLNSIEVLDSLDSLRKDISIVSFFSETLKENLHQTSLWKDSLDGITSSIIALSQAPTSRVNAQHNNHREDEGTWRVVAEFGRNQKIWDIDVVRDVYEQDSTLFPGISESIIDPHTFSRTEKYATRRGERAHPGWRGGYSEF